MKTVWIFNAGAAAVIAIKLAVDGNYTGAALAFLLIITSATIASLLK